MTSDDSIPRTVRELIDRMAMIRGDAPFLIAPDSGRTVTFRGLQAYARVLAARLYGWNLVQGDRVAFLLDNGLFTAQLLLGASYAGFVPVPVSIHAGRTLVASTLAHADPRVLFVASDHEEMLDASPGRPVRLVRAHPDDGPGWTVTPQAAVPLPEVRAEDDALIAYTSGTTGRPKGALFSQAAIVASPQPMIQAYGLGPPDRTLCVLPLYHGNARNTTLMGTLASGGSVVMPRRFDVAAFWELMVRHQCTWAALVPTLIARLLSGSDPPGGARALARVRFVRSSAAPLAATVHRDFEARFGVPLIQGMGATEAGTIVLTNPAPPFRGKPGSVGRPFGVEVRVVDEAGEVLPPEHTGSLVVRSPSVMKGYYRDQAATAEVLGPDGWLRTGDLGHFDADGYFFVVGHAQDFIKKGGVRINLREVEDAVARHPAVLEAAAVGVPDPYLGEEIVAFVVPRPGRAVTAGELGAFCERQLGAFEAPVRFEMATTLHRGPSGKPVRGRLLEEAGATVAATPPEPRPPATTGAAALSPAWLQGLVAETWAAILGIDRIGAHDDFFALGGHSLLGARAVARLRGALHAEIPLRFLFEAPTPARFAARIQGLHAHASASAGPAPAPRGGPLPLSPAQARMWRHCQGPRAGDYLVTRVYDVKGRLDLEILARSLSEIIRRHEILRTSYTLVEGEPVQMVRPAEPVGLAVVDARRPPSDGTVEQAVTSHLDLAGGPIIRIFLLRFSAVDHQLWLHLHHLGSDRQSAEILFAELRALYGAFASGEPTPLPELPLQYGDYALWQHRRLAPDSKTYRGQLAYWVDRLAAPPKPLALPFLRRWPPAADPEEGTETWPYGEELRRRVDAFGRHDRVSPFMTLVASVAALLHHATGRPEVMIGTYASLRTWPQLEPLIGLFANLVVLRVRVDPARSFRELVAETRTATLEAFEHADVGFETVRDALRRARRPAPDLQVIVVHAGHTRETLTLPGLEVTPTIVPVPKSVRAARGRFPWGLTVQAADEGVLSAVFDPRRYAPEGARWLLAELAALLAHATNDPTIPVAKLTLGKLPMGRSLPWLSRVLLRLSGV